MNNQICAVCKKQFHTHTQAEQAICRETVCQWWLDDNPEDDTFLEELI